jgi:ABC-type microcin C transport system permease subunit YejB
MSNPLHLLALVSVLVLYLLPAVLTAKYAERKGRTLEVYLLASLIIGWPFPLLVAAVLPRRAAADDGLNERAG